MMQVDYGRGEGHVMVQAVGVEITKVKDTIDTKVDKRQPLWDKLDGLGISYKKNMSKAKLEGLLK